MIVTWKAAARPILLTSDNAVLAHQKKGTVTIAVSHQVLPDSPFVRGRSGGLTAYSG